MKLQNNIKITIEITIALISVAIINYLSAYIYFMLYAFVENLKVYPTSGPFAYEKFVKLLCRIICTIIILIISGFSLLHFCG